MAHFCLAMKTLKNTVYLEASSFDVRAQELFNDQIRAVF